MTEQVVSHPAEPAIRPQAPQPKRPALVMVCDVDIDVPDATRTHTLEVASGFASHGYQVHLVTRGGDPHVDGVIHHRARGTEAATLPRVADLNLRAAALLLRKRRKASKCYIRYKWSNVPLTLVARLFRYRVVTQVDDIQFGKGYVSDLPIVFDYCKRVIATVTGRASHGLVAITPQIKALLVDDFHVPSKRIAVLPNGVDTDSVTPVERSDAMRRLGLDENQRFLVFCGRFAPWVDFDLIVRSFAIVAERHSELRLLLVGDGPERSKVEDLAQKLGVRARVTVTGFVSSRAEINDLLGAATVTVMAHRSEYVGRIGVSPTKLAEYMASGRAIVAKDVPGVKEALQSSAAGVVVGGTPEAMAAGIERLLDDGRADELGATGRRVAEEAYTWQSIVDRTLPLFA